MNDYPLHRNPTAIGMILMMMAPWATDKAAEYAWQNGVKPIAASGYSAVAQALEQEATRSLDHKAYMMSQDQVVIQAVPEPFVLPVFNTIYATTSSTVSGDAMIVRGF